MLHNEEGRWRVSRALLIERAPVLGAEIRAGDRSSRRHRDARDERQGVPGGFQRGPPTESRRLSGRRYRGQVCCRLPERAGPAFPARERLEVRGDRRVMTGPEHIVHARIRRSDALDGHAETAPLAGPRDVPKTGGMHDDLSFEPRAVDGPPVHVDSVDAVPAASRGCRRSVRTGQRAMRTTCSATLPIALTASSTRPLVPMTMALACTCSA